MVLVGGAEVVARCQVAWYHVKRQRDGARFASLKYRSGNDQQVGVGAAAVIAGGVLEGVAHTVGVDDDVGEGGGGAEGGQQVVGDLNRIHWGVAAVLHHQRVGHADRTVDVQCRSGGNRFGQADLGVGYDVGEGTDDFVAVVGVDGRRGVRSAGDKVTGDSAVAVAVFVNAFGAQVYPGAGNGNLADGPAGVVGVHQANRALGAVEQDDGIGAGVAGQRCRDGVVGAEVVADRELEGGAVSGVGVFENVNLGRLFVVERTGDHAGSGRVELGDGAGCTPGRVSAVVRGFGQIPGEWTGVGECGAFIRLGRVGQAFLARWWTGDEVAGALQGLKLPVCLHGDFLERILLVGLHIEGGTGVQTNRRIVGDGRCVVVVAGQLEACAGWRMVWRAGGIGR